MRKEVPCTLPGLTDRRGRCAVAAPFGLDLQALALLINSIIHPRIDYILRK